MSLVGHEVERSMRILVGTTKPCIGRLKQFGAWHGYMCAAKYAMHGERIAVEDRAGLRVLSLVTSPDELRAAELCARADRFLAAGCTGL